MHAMNNQVENKAPLDVLLVEDDLIIQHVHRYMLEQLSCHVDSAVTGLEALEKLHHKTQSSNTIYDIVFVDLGLPDISGFDVVQRIDEFKKNQIALLPTIVVLTCYSAAEQKDACESLGAAFFMQKPVDIKVMREFLSQF